MMHNQNWSFLQFVEPVLISFQREEKETIPVFQIQIWCRHNPSADLPPAPSQATPLSPSQTDWKRSSTFPLLHPMEHLQEKPVPITSKSMILLQIHDFDFILG